MRTLVVGFAGTYQCRLATDPDPYDDPYGRSGMHRALPGEPPLDRVIRFQPAGTFLRPHCDEVTIGVSVREARIVSPERPDVIVDELLGAPVDLVGAPVYEGRNGIVADDGREAIVPFHLRIGTDGARLERGFADRYEFPHLALKSSFVSAPAGILRAPGAPDVGELIRARHARLRAARAAAPDADGRAVLDARLNGFVERQLAFATAIMAWGVPLRGTRRTFAVPGLVEAPPDPVTQRPPSWAAALWMGQWDPDAFCGFAYGSVSVPLADPAPDLPVVPGRFDAGAANRP